MKIKIQILSPVHIGTGEKKNRMAFIIKNQNISFINEDLFNFLVNKTGLTDKFIKWAQEGGNDISQFLKDHSEIKKEVLNNPLYSLPIRGTIEKEVALHIKDPSNQFFIPGSSIKGAIRTALLYTVLEETKPNIDYLLKGISNTDIKGVLNLEKRYAKWAGMEIEKFVFRAGFIKSNRIISYSDAKYDLLKFIHFSDAYPIEAQYSVMPVTVIFSVSKTKMKTKSFIINVEVIEKGKFLCNLEIDMKTLLALKNVDEKKEWINLKEKFKNVFAFSLDELTLNNLKEYEKKIVDRLLEAAYKFFQKKKEKDLELINGKEIEIDNQTFKVENLKKNYPEVKKGVIQLGFGTGWYGKTVGLYFDRDTIDKFRLRFKAGWSDKFANNQPIWPFPETIRVAFWVENNLPFIFPLGWICLEFY